MLTHAPTAYKHSVHVHAQAPASIYTNKYWCAGHKVRVLHLSSRGARVTRFASYPWGQKTPNSFDILNVFEKSHVLLIWNWFKIDQT